MHTRKNILRYWYSYLRNAVLELFLTEMEIYYIYPALTIAGRYIRSYNYMTMIKEKIINAVTVMNDNDAEVVWNLIVKKFPSIIQFNYLAFW